MDRRRQYSLKEDLCRVWSSTILVLVITSPFWFFLLYARPPKFSVELVDAKSLDDGGAPLMSTAFNVTMRASNRRVNDVCYRHGEAAVRYSGFTVAWGRTRAFCVGKKGARDVPVVAWADGLGVPRPLRQRLAADARAGAVELELDVRLFRGDDGSGRPTVLSCKVTAGGTKAPGFTPCTVFAAQNWASEIALAWMQYF